MTVVDNPIEEIFRVWKEEMESVVGDNCSMDNSIVINKTPYARMIFTGNKGSGYDITGNECAVEINVQVEFYSNGVKPLKQSFDMDAVSHRALTYMGFRRTYGLQFINNEDRALTRSVARYSLLYTGQLTTI